MIDRAPTREEIELQQEAADAMTQILKDINWVCARMDVMPDVVRRHFGPVGGDIVNAIAEDATKLSERVRVFRDELNGRIGR